MQNQNGDARAQARRAKMASREQAFLRSVSQNEKREPNFLLLNTRIPQEEHFGEKHQDEFSEKEYYEIENLRFLREIGEIDACLDRNLSDTEITFVQKLCQGVRSTPKLL